MGKVTHAYITYTDDTKKFFTVPITEIKCYKHSETHIQPKNDSDFDKRKRYYVKWSDCDPECNIDHAHCGYYSAFIFFLGESVDHIQEKISNGGRLIIPSGVPSSESDEPVKSLRRQKHNTLVQDVLKKKNSEILDKHKAKTFLAARKELINNSDNEDDHQESDNIDYDSGKAENSKEIERIRAKEKLRVRKDLFGGKDIQQQEPVDQVNNDIWHDEGAGCSTTSTRQTAVNNKPIITRNEAVNIKLRISHKSKTNNGKPSERCLEKKTVNPKVHDDPSNNSNAEEDSDDDQERPVRERLPLSRKSRKSETVNSEVHDHPSNNSNAEEDSDDNQERPVRERLPLRVKKRKPGRIVDGLRKKVHREILDALQYYENQEADRNVRKRYEISGDNMIHLGEDLETSATVWFLIQQDKPQIFFSNMLDLLWTRHALVNRCQNKKKVTTRLQGRSPMKELTPTKKKLCFGLYSDYLDRKKIKGIEKMQCLAKVPYLITTKINYLRTKYYNEAA